MSTRSEVEEAEGLVRIELVSMGQEKEGEAATPVGKARFKLQVVQTVLLQKEQLAVGGQTGEVGVQSPAAAVCSSPLLQQAR